MKRKSLFGLSALLLMFLFVIAGCPSEPPPPPPEAPDTTAVEPVDTTPEPPPPPPPPPPELKESQLKMIHFEFDKYNLTSEARSGLEHNYQLLKEFPDVIIEIEGHCDERGTVEYNLSLGEKRAKAAKEYLVNLGIAENRIKTISYGKERPLVNESNEKAWSMNRRCEFDIISQ